jgi:cytochrome c2
MKTQFYLLTVTLSLLVSTLSFGQDGEKLFKANCTACHTVGKGKLVGPDLLGVETRHKEAWMLKWIKSSQKMVKAGDPEAVRLFKENNGLPMTDQMLKDDEIKSVLAYIKTAGTAPAKPAEVAAPVADNATTPAAAAPAKEASVQSPSILNLFSVSEYVLMSVILFLGIVIWILSSTIKTLVASEK